MYQIGEPKTKTNFTMFLQFFTVSFIFFITLRQRVYSFKRFKVAKNNYYFFSRVKPK